MQVYALNQTLRGKQMDKKFFEVSRAPNFNFDIDQVSTGIQSELSELELALVGGGIGDVVHA